MNNTNSKSEAESRSRASAFPYALLVPLLVMLVHDAYTSMTGWSFRNNALVAQPMHPIIVASLGVIALISYFVIRPFRDRAASRWAAFLSCVTIFSSAAILLLPKLAE